LFVLGVFNKATASTPEHICTQYTLNTSFRKRNCVLVVPFTTCNIYTLNYRKPIIWGPRLIRQLFAAENQFTTETLTYKLKLVASVAQ